MLSIKFIINLTVQIFCTRRPFVPSMMREAKIFENPKIWRAYKHSISIEMLEKILGVKHGVHYFFLYLFRRPSTFWRDVLWYTNVRRPSVRLSLRRKYFTPNLRMTYPNFMKLNIVDSYDCKTICIFFVENQIKLFELRHFVT